jgi:hypothetical protein
MWIGIAFCVIQEALAAATTRKTETAGRSTAWGWRAEPAKMNEEEASGLLGFRAEVNSIHDSLAKMWNVFSEGQTETIAVTFKFSALKADLGSKVENTMIGIGQIRQALKISRLFSQI